MSELTIEEHGFKRVDNESRRLDRELEMAELILGHQRAKKEQMEASEALRRHLERGCQDKAPEWLVRNTRDGLLTGEVSIEEAAALLQTFTATAR